MTAKDLFTLVLKEKLYCLADGGTTLVQVHSVNDQSNTVDLILVKSGIDLVECFNVNFSDFKTFQDYLFISDMKIWGGDDILTDMALQFFENEPLTLK